MARRLIGTGTTDSNGRITVSYAGTGAGKLQLVAVNGNLVSETYELYDTLFYDIGTSAPAENTWVMNGFTPTYSTDGTTITSSTYATCFANKKGTGLNVYDWDSPVCIEFDINGVDSTDAGVQIYDETNNCSRTLAQLGVTGNNHVKIIVESNKIRYVIDDVEKTSQQFDISIGTFRVGFRGTGTLTFKNFMIYPI